MNEAQRRLRECMQAFVDDLSQIAERAIREAVHSVLTSVKEQAVTVKPTRQKKVVLPPPRGRQKQPLGNLEKLERQVARQKQKQRRQLVLPLLNDAAAAPVKEGEIEETAKPAKATAQAEAAPAPLFVHKRKRSGEIEVLARNGAPADAPAAPAPTV